MNKKFTTAIAAIALVLAATLSSCSITFPVAISSNPIGSKVGTSEATTYFYVLAFDEDFSIRAAAKNGGITRVATVDVRQKNILGVVQKYTTTVTGE
jgi:hypothetical protein